LPSSSFYDVCSLTLFPLFATGVVDTGGKFAAGVVDTGGNLPPVSLTPVENLPPGINNTSATGGKIYHLLLTRYLPPVLVVDIGGAPWLANISANFPKNLKRS
jgi:hypothetical protein